MADTVRAFAFAATPLLLLSMGTEVAAQQLTRAMVESQIKEWIAAWSANDPARIAAVDPPVDGFGFRTLEARSSDTPPATYLNTIKSFFADKDYYRVELNEVHTKVDGNIGLAWGFYTESFKRKGHPPEKLRVRFTRALKCDRGHCRTVLHHGDIQNFDQKGNYLPTY